jgi:hypothetical protein
MCDTSLGLSFPYGYPEPVLVNRRVQLDKEFLIEGRFFLSYLGSELVTDGAGAPVTSPSRDGMSSCSSNAMLATALTIGFSVIEQRSKYNW